MIGYKADIPRPAGCGINPLKQELANCSYNKGAIPTLKLAYNKHEIAKMSLYYSKETPKIHCEDT